MIGVISVLCTLALGIAIWCALARQTVRGFKELKNGFKEKYRDVRDSGDRLAAATMILKMVTYISMFITAGVLTVFFITAPWINRSDVIRALSLADAVDNTVLFALTASFAALAAVAIILLGISYAIERR